MGWKKYHMTVNVPNYGKTKTSSSNSYYTSSERFGSFLPEIYAGHPMRIQRYSQYDQMDYDNDVFTALSTIADFCTQSDEKTRTIFQINYNDDPSETETEILKTCLRQWCSINEFQKRIWRIFRNTLKYGDCVFIRDPETYKWIYVDMTNVEMVYVNEAEGKEPTHYVIKDLDLNLQTLTATQPWQYGSNLHTDGTNTLQNRPVADPNRFRTNTSVGSGIGTNPNSRFGSNNSQNTFIVDATHIVHLSLSEGLDANWPFGTSILESVFKTFRQKELLEEAIIIYRIQRAPERRIFYVDVGNIPPHLANSYMERLKNEILQKRIPSRGNNGSSVMDATYNPMSMLDDYFFAVTAEGRGSRVETLPAGENLGQIDDLRFWQNKLIRGLGVPASYIPNGPDDGTHQYNDGRIGTAYIQEFRFAKYCMRLQNLLSDVFDHEFKLFLKSKGYEIDSSLFNINFNEPMYFGDYAEMERESVRLDIFDKARTYPFISTRYAMKRYLGWSEDEILQNEKEWIEENGDNVPEGTADDFGGGISADLPGLESIGLNGSDFDDDIGDLEDLNNNSFDTDSGDVDSLDIDNIPNDMGEPNELQ